MSFVVGERPVCWIELHLCDGQHCPCVFGSTVHVSSGIYVCQTVVSSGMWVGVT